ncbi:chlamydia polymorphic membrane middle domain protein, partial [Chlamydia avium]
SYPRIPYDLGRICCRPCIYNNIKSKTRLHILSAIHAYQRKSYSQ